MRSKIEFKNTLLQDIDHHSSGNTFITLDELETLYGKSGSELRPFLEDLKEGGLVVEHEEGFQVSPSGRTLCSTRWA